MSEGPQVKRKTEWLHRHLCGQAVRACRTTREDLSVFADSIIGQRITRVFCKGKHIFLAFEAGRFLHNHLLMRGNWRRYADRLLLLPEGAWLAMAVGDHTICNLHGQMLRVETAVDVEQALASLGPDVMARPFPAQEVAAALRGASGPIGPVLPEQSRLCGMGNIAKSEALFEARLDPRFPAAFLTPHATQRLLAAIQSVCWASYNRGGRWICHVYQRRGQACRACGTKITRIVQAGRSTYFCPACQRE